jgi:hypothetical protein
MNRRGLFALLLVAAAGWLAFKTSFRYWPTMMWWHAVISNIVYVATMALYLS